MAMRDTATLTFTLTGARLPIVGEVTRAPRASGGASVRAQNYETSVRNDGLPASPAAGETQRPIGMQTIKIFVAL